MALERSRYGRWCPDAGTNHGPSVPEGQTVASGVDLAPKGPRRLIGKLMVMRSRARYHRNN